MDVAVVINQSVYLSINTILLCAQSADHLILPHLGITKTKSNKAET